MNEYMIQNDDLISKLHIQIPTSKGGEGSGFFNHAGRPGHRGGSIPEADIISKKFLAEIKTKWPQGTSRREMAESIFDVRAVPGDKVVTMLNKDKELVGVMTLDDMAETGYLWVNVLATRDAGKGYGRKMIARAAASAAKLGTALKLLATMEAVKFYKKIGMTKNGNTFTFSADQCKRIAATMKEELMSAEADALEPSTGVYTVPAYEVEKGGEGSGNFGHKGRPGLVGGSITVDAYHGSYEAVVKSIVRDGIRAQGVRRNWDSDYYFTPERRGSVYLSKSFLNAQSYALHAARQNSANWNLMYKPVVFKVKVPEDALVQDEKDSSGFRIAGTIKPEWIHSYTYNGGKSWFRVRTQKDEEGFFYLPVVFVFKKEEDMKVSKGGPGSGHFGHSGIPGHQGGSAADGQTENDWVLTQKYVLVKDIPEYWDRFGEKPEDNPLAQFRYENFARRQETIKKFLSGEEPKAFAVSGDFACVIMQNSGEIFLKKGDRYPVPTGTWQGWWDEDLKEVLNISKKDYNALSIKDRAKADAMVQAKKYAPSQFDRTKEDFWPQTKSGEKVEKNILLKGGPGSGHFGHSGIPGHQGGSLPDNEEERVYYHGTANKKIIDKILEEGIKPASQTTVGRMFGSELYTGDRKDSVFLTTDIEDAVYFCKNAISKMITNSNPNAIACIFKVVVPKEVELQNDEEWRSGHAFFVKGGIPKEWIKGYDIGKVVFNKPISELRNYYGLLDTKAMAISWRGNPDAGGVANRALEFDKGKGDEVVYYVPIIIFQKVAKNILLDEVITKEYEKNKEAISTSKLVIKSEDRRLVYGEVYAPLHIDTDKEAMTASEIEKMAHNFLSRGLTNKIDIGHNLQESGSVIVESFIARKNDPDGFIEGSWVIGVLVPEDVWPAVKNGELNGFSFYGKVEKKEMKARVLETKQLSGETELSTSPNIAPHVHKVDISFNDGKIIECYSDMNLGHRHLISQSTATKEEMGHSHRLIIIESKEEDFVEKGGAGSGHYGHAGIPGHRGGSAASDLWDNGKFNTAEYRKLNPNSKNQVLKKVVTQIKSVYTPVNAQKRILLKIAPKNRDKWLSLNKAIGKYEGIARAMINKGMNQSGTEQRKYFHFAVSLFSKAFKTKTELKNLT